MNLFKLLFLSLLVSCCLHQPAIANNVAHAENINTAEEEILFGFFKLSKKLKNVSVGNASNIWGVDSSNKVFRKSGNLWQHMSNAPSNMDHVSVGSDGAVWGVTTNNKVYQFLNGIWSLKSGLFRQISVGKSNHVWGVNTSNQVFKRNGNSWQLIANAPFNIDHVSVGNDGVVWGVTSNNKIYRFLNGIWQLKTGLFKNISVGNSSHICGVSPTNSLLSKVGNIWNVLGFNLFNKISIGSDGTTCGVDANDNIYINTPTTPANGPDPDCGSLLSYWDLDACNASNGGNSNYGELTAETNIAPGFSNVTATNLSHGGNHSCTPGFSGPAVCASARSSCSFQNNSHDAFKFSVTVNPTNGNAGKLSGLSFYEAAPSHYNWIGGGSGDNDPPSRYGIRVLKNGQQIYKETGLHTTHSWSLEEFDFSNDPDFTVTGTTTFSFELLGYCKNGLFGYSLWDVDEIKVFGCVEIVDPCVGEGGDSDNDGVCDNFDCQPNNPAFPATPGMACNDGNPNTTNDVVTADGCGCQGTQIDPCANLGGDSDGDGTCNNLDCQPFNPAFPATPGMACNDGNPNTTNDIITADGCGCQGTQIDPCANLGGDSDGDGTCNNLDCQPFNPAFPATPGMACNDGNPNTTNDIITADGCGCAGTPVGPTCSVSTGSCFIMIDGLSSSDQAKVFNSNWQVIWECNPWVSGAACNSAETITNLQNGTYYVQACGQTQTVTITGCSPVDPCAGQGGDSDGDGICNNQDCQPNNSAFPATPGMACNDGNPNTTNDVVTADGCGCQGTPVGPTCSVTTGSCFITITGLNNSDYAKVFDSNWSIVWECNPWANGGCSSTETITNLQNGTYYVQACGSTETVQISGCSGGGGTTPSLSFSNPNVQVNENGGSATLTIGASSPATSPITVNYSTNNGSATGGSDFTPVSATATIPAGSSSVNVSIPILNDGNTESTESFTIALSNPTGATISGGTGTITILDDDVAQACNVTTGSCSITITGLNNSDYAKVFNSNWSIVWECNPWANGGCSSTETITNLQNGTYYVQACGSTETVQISGCSGGGGTTPSLSFSNPNVQVNENGGSATLTIGASSPATSPITVNYSTNNGSANGGTDYTPVSNTATIPAGSTSVNISIPILNDGETETTESFTVSLSNPTGATVSGGTGTITILDDDVAPSCNVTTGSCSITITGLNGSDYAKVFDTNWQIIWECNPWVNGGCNSTETITNLENGTYNVQACGQTQPVTVSGCVMDPCAGQGGDSDGDGTCNNQDCQPNNPAFPATPGSSCNDGNPNTENDMVTADGCGCAGTLVQVCAPTEIAYWSLDQCVSNSGNGTNTDFSEFTAATTTPFGFSVVNASIISKNNNAAHSCTAGESGIAMCSGIRTHCNWVDNSHDAFRFSVTIAPTGSTPVSLTGFNFFERAPLNYSHINGNSGDNDPPSHYGMRVLKNGQEIYQKTGRSTTHSWSYESFDLSDDPDFVVTTTTTFEFELLGYCRSNGFSGLSVWDIDELRIEACAGDGALAPLEGQVNSDLLFNAIKNGRDVNLNWVTNSDYKNDYFEVEHSMDGINFELLERVSSNTVSSDYTNYNEKDRNAAKGINYYRLKQIYLDGTYEYSEVRQVNIELDTHDFGLFPNPATNQVFVNLKEFVGNSAIIQIHNSLGQQVKEIQVDNVTEDPVRISLEGMTPGVHAVFVDVDGKKTIGKMLVVAKL